jgi:Trk K+ transport system NAD-binding subunit
MAMNYSPLNRSRWRGWRSWGALFFFGSALVGFLSGVTVSERPEVASASLLTMAYYSLSLFVVGGVDLGTPAGGPQWGRVLVWLAYFGAPILAASTLITAILTALTPRSWQMRRISDHIIVVGANELSLSYLRVLRREDKKVRVVVVCREIETAAEDEIVQSFQALVLVGDITHEFFLDQLRPQAARKILLFGQDSMRGYEAASLLTRKIPGIGDRIVLHCANLRFMRAMATTRVAKECQTFNSYHLAASGLVRNYLLKQFRETQPRDTVVLAGFGRFGQTILEELQACAIDEMSTVVIIDKDAHRRVLVADEQMEFAGGYRRELLEGDISNPEVWERVMRIASLDAEDTVVVLGTGREEENLRTALWIRKNSPRTRLIARSSRESQFATEVGREHDITSISITQLIEEHIPAAWMGGVPPAAVSPS